MTLKKAFVAILLCSVLAPELSYAFGKKRHTAPAEPADTQAWPTRDVAFGQFLSTPFMLPDGKTKIDMAVMLPDLVLTVMQQSQNKLRATDSTPVSETSPARFILKGGITAFEASNMAGSITIGYKPGVGDIGNGVLTGVEGKVTLNIGQLDMDFHIVDTVRGETVAVGHGSAVTPGVGASVEVDFGVIKTGADFVYRSPMAPIFRSAVQKAIVQMATDPKTNSLMDWQAAVSRVDTASKQVFFNAGGRDDVQANNIFVVYDNTGNLIGKVKVRSVEHEQSGAQFKDDSSDKQLGSVRAGDPVKIYYFGE